MSIFTEGLMYNSSFLLVFNLLNIFGSSQFPEQEIIVMIMIKLKVPVIKIMY